MLISRFTFLPYLSFLKLLHVRRYSLLVPFRAAGPSCPRRQSPPLHGEVLPLLLLPSPGWGTMAFPTALIFMDGGSGTLALYAEGKN